MACETKQTCGTCRFWSSQVFSGDLTGEFPTLAWGLSEGSGVCRRNPPAVEAKPEFRWPVTTKFDWCGEWREEPVEQPPRSKLPLPTEWVYVMPGKSLNFDESVVKFRGRSFSSHIRSTAGVARWACDLLLKEFGIRLQEGKIPVVVDATGVGGGVAERFRGELGATVIEYFASETAISKWKRLASATGMQIRGPAYHAAYLKSTISDPDLLEKHLTWIDEWIDWVSGEGSFHRTR